jgi:[ribosomal protein S5]-alanine N-acetyltransferase
MSLLDRTAAIGDCLRSLPSMPVLAGPRIRLRGPREDDGDDLFALFSEESTMRFWSRPPMRRRHEADSLIASILEGFERRQMLNWVIADRSDDRVIGSCTLYDIHVPHLRGALGYALRVERCGQGLASEAVALALRWGFGRLGLNRIEADTHPDNVASQRLLQRMGFTFEGRLRQHFATLDELQDSSIWGLLAEEWRSRG